jgi:hypothetical protein
MRLIGAMPDTDQPQLFGLAGTLISLRICADCPFDLCLPLVSLPTLECRMAASFLNA